MTEAETKTSKAKLAAIKRYQDKNWRPNPVFSKEVRERMEQAGITEPNQFIRESVLIALENVEIVQDRSAEERKNSLHERMLQYAEKFCNAQKNISANTTDTDIDSADANNQTEAKPSE